MWEFLGGSKRVGSPPVRPAQAYTLNEQHSAPSPLLSDSHGNSPERQDGVSEPLCVLPGCASPTSSTLTEARSPPVPEEEADVFVDTLGPAVQTLTALRQADSVPSPGHSAAQPRLRAHSLSSAPLNSMTSTGSKRHIHKRLSKLLAATVNFRDVSFVTREEPAEPADVSEEGQYATLSTGVQKNKLIIIMVGLPARGKTFLCNKLMRYLNWLGHETRHFNVGQYRRKQKGDEEIQDAQFFDHSNEAGLEARNRALNAALEDLESWLMCENSQNAILDATNSTVERRQYLRQRFHGKWSYLLVESVCNDEEVLMNNYLNKMRFSPDYSGVNTQKALQDFIDRIKKYESVYTPVSVDRTYHYIQLNNMITGRAHLDVNRISGYIQGKIVFYLMQHIMSYSTMHAICQASAAWAAAIKRADRTEL